MSTSVSAASESQPTGGSATRSTTSRMTAGDRVRWVLRGLGELLITAGIVVLLFAFYEVKITGVYTAHQQHDLEQRLTRTWAQPAPKGIRLAPFVEGQGIARIYLPTLGKDQMHVVVEGVSHADLKRGPGHYPGTALPGGLGNVTISGHRTTYGAPFNRLDELHTGDPIVLETATMFFTYRVIEQKVVSPQAIGETYPVPERAGVAPTQHLLTLTTCNPKYSARTRLIIRALLETSQVKAPGVVPPALEG
ncbi:MAG: class E sortase [Mycobacteriales bacterium]